MNTRLAVLVVLLCLGATTALAATAEVAVTPAADVAGKGSGRSLTEAVRQALSAASVPLATPAEIAKAARAAKVKPPKALKAAQAAKLARAGNFAAVVVYRKARGGAFTQVIDARGQVLLERMIHVAKANVVPDDTAALATAVAQALGLSVAPSLAAPQPATGATQSAAASAPPSAPEPAPGAAPAATAAYSGPDETASAQAQSEDEPAAGYFLRVGLFAGAGERLFLAPGFSYTTSSPYTLGGVSVEVFPIHSVALGIIADFAYGPVKDEFANGTGTFNATDLRFDAAIAYRWRLFSGPYGTFLIPRLGVGLRNFDAPASADLAADNRFFGEGGLQLTQPIIPKYLRLTVGAAALPFAKQSAAGQGAYGPSSSFGLQWMAELGGDLFAGLEWGLQVDQERFMDSYSAPVDTGVEVDTAYTLQLRYRL